MGGRLYTSRRQQHLQSPIRPAPPVHAWWGSRSKTPNQGLSTSVCVLEGWIGQSHHSWRPQNLLRRLNKTYSPPVFCILGGWIGRTHQSRKKQHFQSSIRPTSSVHVWWKSKSKTFNQDLFTSCFACFEEVDKSVTSFMKNAKPFKRLNKTYSPPVYGILGGE